MKWILAWAGITKKQKIQPLGCAQDSLQARPLIRGSA